jgi:FkbM family methyltransferase
MNLKAIIRNTLMFLRIDLSKNLQYDRLTHLILKKVIQKDSNCIDVGCHKGEILNDFIHLAPKGEHFAFEPIPYLFENLKSKFNNKAQLFSFALSNEKGESAFQIVKNAPAYSGLKNRRYSDIKNPEIEQIKVELNKLDDIISEEIKIDLIKIDVEGGEFDVVRGGIELIKRDKPTIIFECGVGSSDFYGVSAKDFYELITKEIGLKIYTLKSFANNKKPLNKKEFEYFFQTNKEYYFVASSK